MSWVDPDCLCVLVRDEDGMADCADGTCDCPIHCLCETCGLNHPGDCEEDDDE